MSIYLRLFVLILREAIAVLQHKLLDVVEVRLNHCLLVRLLDVLYKLLDQWRHRLLIQLREFLLPGREYQLTKSGNANLEFLRSLPDLLYERLKLLFQLIVGALLLLKNFARHLTALDEHLQLAHRQRLASAGLDEQFELLHRSDANL